MKSKIIKILEKHHIILPVFLVLALVAGYFVYQIVGRAPEANIAFNQENESISSLETENFTEGEELSLAFPKGGRVSVVNVKIGDIVKKGQVLASLDNEDAKGALEIARANYEKVINGATGPDIDVAKAAVATAKINFDSVIAQQELAVKTAYRNYLNSNLEAVPADNTGDYYPPVISGAYILDREGEINIHFYNSQGGISYALSGLIEGTGMLNEITAQPLGNSGLYIKNLNGNVLEERDWTITIPNKKASNYLSNYNAYLSAKEAQARLVAIAQANYDQANSALILKQTNARPEDIAAVAGAFKVAEGVYNNNFIYAPADGVITAVNLEVGEIAIMNMKAVGMIVKITK